MIMFRSSFLAVDESDDEETKAKNTGDADDDGYEEGEERSYPAYIRDTDPDDGSFVSYRSDDDDVYTSTGNDDDYDRYKFEQEYTYNQSRATAPHDSSF